MCWFSLYGRTSTRKAIEGEELVVQDFPNHHRRWLTSPQNPQKAVCLADGCKLRLNGIPEDLQKVLGVGSEAVVEFREELFERLVRHPSYDVLMFPDGHHLALSLLPLGMKIDVLAEAVVTPVKEEEMEPIYVKGLHESKNR